MCFFIFKIISAFIRLQTEIPQRDRHKCNEFYGKRRQQVQLKCERVSISFIFSFGKPKTKRKHEKGKRAIYRDIKHKENEA